MISIQEHGSLVRQISYAEALHEALDLCLERDPAVYLMGLGVPDPRGIFGTTRGLAEKHGSRRVQDMPTAENAMAGVAIGSAIAGMRPVLVYQRVDFALLSVEQLVNQAAKWHYMFGGQQSVPLVARMLIGRGWGQGAQHSQSLQSWFAHVPGLRVVMPATAYDAKGLLIASIEDDNPVIFLEHRWLYNLKGHVPGGYYRVPLGQARIMRPGTDVTIVGISHMALEALRAADILAAHGIDAEIVDLRCASPLDRGAVLESVRRTGRLVVADTSWKSFGLAAEVVTTVVEEAMDALKSPPRRVTLPDCPTPTSHALAESYYPRAIEIARAALHCVLGDGAPALEDPQTRTPLDVPDPTFTGPF